MSSNTKRFLILTILLTGALVVACGKKKVEQAPPPPPTVIDAEIITSSQVNPDGSGRSSPIVVRVYELKTLGAFEAADFFTLFENDTAQLGGDLVHREEFSLQPGGLTPYLRKPPAETKYLAVMAAYRNLNQAVWKSSVAIPANQTNRLRILLEELAVNIHVK